MKLTMPKDVKGIVGMTITGASINSALISQLKPDVVLVEEAAEAKSSETSSTSYRG